MPVKYPRDPNDPAFPHGRQAGYRRGCRDATFNCPADPTCQQAEIQRNYYGRHPELAPAKDAPTHYRANAVRTYLLKWVERDWSVATIAAAAGWDATDMGDLLAERTGAVPAEQALAAMTVDEDKLLEVSATVPAHLARWRLGSLAANGWALEAQAAQLGYPADLLHGILDGRVRYITREVYEDIEFFFHGVSSVPGTNREARKMAANLGYLQPHDYAPDGTPWGLVENRNERDAKRWDTRDKAARLRLEVLRLAIVDGATLAQSADLLGVADRTVSRIRKEAGLKYEQVVRDQMVLAPGQEGRVAEILEVLEEWERNPLDDPYVYCRRLDLMDEEKWAGVDLLGKPKLVAA